MTFILCLCVVWGLTGSFLAGLGTCMFVAGCSDWLGLVGLWGSIAVVVPAIILHRMEHTRR